MTLILSTLLTVPGKYATSGPDAKAIAELNDIVKTRAKFIKVHAAEYLIWTGHAEYPLQEFIKEEAKYSTEPKYRVVIWRVLAQAESDPARKKMWIDKIYAAYGDLNGPDRTHATETLAKLRQPVSVAMPEATAHTLSSTDRILQTYALWASSYGSAAGMAANKPKFLEMALNDTDLNVRRVSAFVLRQTKETETPQWERLYTAALAQKTDDPLYVTLLATALVTAPANVPAAKCKKLKTTLLKDFGHYAVGPQTEAVMALAEKGSKADLKILNGILDAKNTGAVSDEVADLRASAAYAILKINHRK